MESPKRLAELVGDSEQPRGRNTGCMAKPEDRAQSARLHSDFLQVLHHPCVDGILVEEGKMSLI